ncbi:MAG: peptidoglycan DD-metalloendopeptidase family protein [Bacteroidota bacterium]
MFKKLFSILILVLAMAVSASAQTKEELQKKEQELQKEIADLNRSLNETQSNKKLSLKQLAIIKKKINKREELVNSINRQVRQMDETIFLNERDIYRLRKELDTLKVKYAKSIVFAYKNRSSYEYLNFLFSAGSFNDAIKRVTYLKSYRQNRETQASTIVKSDQLLQTKIQDLSVNKKERLTALLAQSEQLKVLQADKKEQDQVVNDLKGKEKELGKQISDKEKQRQKVQAATAAVIRRAIEDARKKADAAAKQEKLDVAKNNTTTAPANTPKNTKPATNEPVTGVTTTARDRTYTPLESTPDGREMSINFENNKGRLPWPVSTGEITAHFGTEPIPGTKLKRKTDGIEISLPVGSTVKSIADGKVLYASDVDGEPLIIVQHGKYFCGYNHLSSVSVSKDQLVKAGTVLGKSGTSIDGEGVLLFMISNDKSVPLNPEPWLKPRR